MPILRGQKSNYAWTSGPNTTITCTFSVNPTQGSSVLCFVQPNIRSIASVKDNGAQLHTFVPISGAGDTRGAFVYRTDNISLPSSGSYTVTLLVAGGTSNIGIMAIEYTGLGSHIRSVTSSGTSNAPTSTGADGLNGYLSFGGMSNNTSANPETITFTTGGVFAEQGKNTDGSSGVAGSCADGILTSDSNNALTWSLGDSPTWNTVQALFAPATPYVSRADGTFSSDLPAGGWGSYRLNINI